MLIKTYTIIIDKPYTIIIDKPYTIIIDKLYVYTPVEPNPPLPRSVVSLIVSTT